MKTRLHIAVLALTALLLLPTAVAAQEEATATDTAMQQRKYDYYFLEAFRLKMQQKYDAAFELLRHCLTIRPDGAAALYETAQYYMYIKMPQRAEAALKKAVANAPDNYWYSQDLANLYVQQKETDQAAALLEDMARRFPFKLDPLYSLLDIYGRQEEYDRMIPILDRLEETLGKNEQFSWEKFRIYQLMGNDKKAFHEIESLASEYPEELRYQVVLGDTYLQNGRHKDAYTVYRRVLDEEPDNAFAMYSLANYYEATGQDALYEQQIDSLLLNKKGDTGMRLTVMRQLIVENEQAGGDSLRVIRLFDRIMQQEPDEAALPMLYAQYLLSKGMNTQAKPVLRTVLDLDPANATARLILLGDIIRQEDYQGVIDLCEPGIDASPDRLEFYFYLAIAYNQAERYDDALATCSKALTHVNKDSNKEMVSDFHTIMGDIYHSKQMNTEAYAAYDQALACNPDNVGALNNYAYYLSLENRELDKAEEMSFRTIKAEPDNATYLDTYAWILFMKGNYTEARLYIDNAMKNGGDESADVVEHCGDIYYMTGDPEGALKYWKQAQDMNCESKTLPLKIEKKKYIPAL